MCTLFIFQLLELLEVLYLKSIIVNSVNIGRGKFMMGWADGSNAGLLIWSYYIMRSQDILLA